MSASPTPEATDNSTFVCACAGMKRSACDGEPFYKEHEGKRYCVLHFPGREKSADFQRAFQGKLDRKDFNFRGVWFPDELSFVDFKFTKETDFSAATFNGDARFTSATFNEGVSFTDAIFNAEADFTNAVFYVWADFSGATFNASAGFTAARFKGSSTFDVAKFRGEAIFNSVTFQEKTGFISATFDAWASFESVTFIDGVHFTTATFNAESDFRLARFGSWLNFYSADFNSEVRFSSATFNGEADFRIVTFADDVSFEFVSFNGDARFYNATFGGHLIFSKGDGPVFGEKATLDLQFARIEKPDRVSFYSLTLSPYWFVNVDSRKFAFTNVEWKRPSIDEEVEKLKGKKISQPHRLLAIACRNLAVNAEESHRYEEASRFRYMAMDARRRESWRGFAFWKLSWWYWLASGYGERIFQAFVVLIGIWLIFALLYTQVGFARWEPRLASESDMATTKRDETGTPLRLSRSLTYSLGVMTLQKPEPRPATTAAQSFVLLETILGPVQAALVALAIRRKFMR